MRMRISTICQYENVISTQYQTQTTYTSVIVAHLCHLGPALATESLADRFQEQQLQPFSNTRLSKKKGLCNVKLPTKYHIPILVTTTTIIVAIRPHYTFRSYQAGSMYKYITNLCRTCSNKLLFCFLSFLILVETNGSCHHATTLYLLDIFKLCFNSAILIWQIYETKLRQGLSYRIIKQQQLGKVMPNRPEAFINMFP